jgi:hypothetical protein
MCANCVAQGAAYVGGAVGALQVMRARARHRRLERQLARTGDRSPATPGDPDGVAIDGDAHVDAAGDVPAGDTSGTPRPVR